MTWTKQAWQVALPVYEATLQMPFLVELREGTLPLEKFQFYMAQDASYLEHFGRTLSVLAAKLTDIEQALAFMCFAQEAIVVEKALHASYFADFGIADKGAIEPACHHYIHFLRSTAALEAVEVGVAAVLPCFWMYEQVGNYVYAHQNKANNPYQKWIDTYAGEEFAASVRKALEIADHLAQHTTETVRQQMTDAFATAARMEYDFWDAAYTLRRW